METQTERDTQDTASTDMLIRSVMVEQKRNTSRDIFPDLNPVEGSAAEVEGMIAAKFGRKQRRSKQKAQKSGAGQSLKARILAYRPTPKHIFWAAIVLVMFLRPWLIPGLVLVAFWVGLIAWLTLGPDRITEWVQSGWDRLHTRHPALAEKLRARGDRFALRFDALLDKLPERWAEKLALPDLSTPASKGEDLEQRPDPFDRLKLPEVYRG